MELRSGHMNMKQTETEKINPVYWAILHFSGCLYTSSCDPIGQSLYLTKLPVCIRKAIQSVHVLLLPSKYTDGWLIALPGT